MQRDVKMLKTEFKNNVLTAYIDGEIDHDSAAKIRARIDGAAQSLKPKQLCLDFSGVSFMDSSGVGLVMGRYRTLAKTGAQLYITGASPQIYKVMKLAGIERLAKLEER